MNRSTFIRRLVTAVACVALIGGAADNEGGATLILPLLCLVAMGFALGRARTSVLDATCWKLGFLGLMFGFLGYVCLAVGMPLRNPVVVLFFVATYPLVTAAQVAFIRVRTVSSQTANYLDGAIVAALSTVALFQWIVPQQIADGQTGWPLFVGLLFPVLGVLSTGATFILGSVVRWRFPPILGFLVAGQAFFLLADLLPLIEGELNISLGLGVRSGAAAYLCVIGATRANDRWVTDEAAHASGRVYFVVWSSAILSLAALMTDNLSTWGRYFAALTIILVGVRLSLAYGEATLANDLRTEARTDELTGLRNRRALRESLDRLVGSSDPFSVLMLDLNDFKATNDTLGHDAGDQMLRTVSARLRRIANKYGERVELFRLGGDEFAIICPDPACAREIAGEAVRLISVPTIIENERIDQSVSVGIATYPSDGQFPGDILRLADAAMYRAKQLRTGFEEHDASLTEEFSQLRILAVLREALVDGSFQLHYQPQVSLHDGSVVGLEALFRLPYNGKFLFTPAVIAAAENAGILSQLTDCVLDRAMQELSSMVADYPNLSISLNVSEQDFSSGTLPERVQRMLTKHRVKPSQVCIEVTEESLLQDPAAAGRTVDGLRAMGMTVSMDDFGVGFSSLTNLRMLVVDELKIDRSFVEGLVSDPRTEALVVSIVELARRLGSKVLIEGIEHIDEVTMARSLGIDTVQGYVFAKPMPLDQLQKWMYISSDTRRRIVVGPVSPTQAAAPIDGRRLVHE